MILNFALSKKEKKELSAVCLAYAGLKTNFKFRGYLKPIWPLVLLGCQNNFNFVIFKPNIETDVLKRD